MRFSLLNLCNPRLRSRSITTWDYRKRQLQGIEVLANALLGLFTFRIEHSSTLHLERRPNSSRSTFTFWNFCIASATVLLVSCLSDALSQRYHFVLPHLQLLRKSYARAWLPTAVFDRIVLRYISATSTQTYNIRYYDFEH